MRRLKPTQSADSSSSYPWDLDWAEGDSPVEHFWTIDLKSSPKDLWPLLADTSDVNARLGLPEMVFEERDGRLHGSSGKLLTRQEWVEVPWEWEIEKSLTAERRYTRGIASVVRARYLLTDRWGGTRLTVYFGWIPRRWWSRSLLQWVNRWLQKRYTKVLGELDELAFSGNPSQAFSAPVNHAKIDESRLGEGLAQLAEAGIPAVEIDRLATHIRRASDDRLFRIRPKVLAFEWGMDLDEVLSLFLHSTQVGLLSISWDVMCPHCQGVRREAHSLGELRELGHCDICDIDFNATSLESIEVTFKVLPEVREVREVFFCSAEPAKKPHIVLQHHLAPGTTYTSDFALPEGRFRLRSATGDGPTLPLEVIAAGGAIKISWAPDSPGSEIPIAIDSHVRLTATNSGEATHSVVLEKLAEDPRALRPSDLFNLQLFRDLFSEESIASGLKLEVGAQTLLFTDIVGSTALYSLLGDTKAFNAVHAHFVALQDVITSRKGAVVKTIGDAMMAAFTHPEEALRAAIEIQQLLRSSEQDIAIRVSVHRGMCLAVRLDTTIDYFGNTVNYAAKMQSITGAGEIACSQEFFALPNIKDIARQHGLETHERRMRSSFIRDASIVLLAPPSRQNE